MIREMGQDVYRIQIPLAGSPLKNLNSYLFRCGERNLLVDTGFNQPSCLKDLRRGLAELQVDMEVTDFFLTHFHSDHCGLISQLAGPHNRIYMGGIDLSQYIRSAYDRENYWGSWSEEYLRQGFPPEDLSLVMAENPAKEYSDSGGTTITPLGDGQEIQVGNRRFTCIITPGHTPGHACLYEPSTETLILGDHVLFDITPNITGWDILPNALGHYLASLEKIRPLAVKLALPAHREQGDVSLTERIDQLKAHHGERLDETLSILQAEPGLTNYQVASRMTWSIRATSWDDFPMAQKWFATGEAKSHLEYLMAEGKVQRKGHELYTYYPV